MIDTHPHTAYTLHVANLEKRLHADEAFRQAIGGEFIAVGKLEYHLLRSLGPADGHLVVDVGCNGGQTSFVRSSMKHAGIENHVTNAISFT